MKIMLKKIRSNGNRRPIRCENWNGARAIRIKRLDSNLKLYKYNTVNLLSCITLDIEYFYVAAHFK